MEKGVLGLVLGFGTTFLSLFKFNYYRYPNHWAQADQKIKSESYFIVALHVTKEITV